jgi:hypothetical protein
MQSLCRNAGPTRTTQIGASMSCRRFDQKDLLKKGSSAFGPQASEIAMRAETLQLPLPIERQSLDKRSNRNLRTLAASFSN